MSVRLTICQSNARPEVDEVFESRDLAMTRLGAWLTESCENFTLTYHDLKAEDARLDVLATATFGTTHYLVGITKE